MTGAERRMMFFRGFGDGAKTSAIKHDDLDYMAGWTVGSRMAREATAEYAQKQGLPPAGVLHLQTEDVPQRIDRTPGAPVRYSVETIQFTGHNSVECCRFMGWAEDVLGLFVDPTVPPIAGGVTLRRGDFIVRGADGQYRVCEQGTFVAPDDK